jgi:hypothetical protein
MSTRGRGHINHGHVEVPVFLDRFGMGYPDAGNAAGAATYGPLSDALAETFTGADAHFSAYSCPEAPYRLAGSGAFDLKPRMVAFVVDWDANADHSRCTDEQWEAFKVKVRAAFKKCGSGYAYRTKGGGRIVWPVEEPLVIDSPTAKARWRESYLEWLALLKNEFDIIGDASCADWPRLYRLPRVNRDGQMTVLRVDESRPLFDRNLDEVGRPDALVCWREPYIAADDPRVVSAGAMGEPIVIPVAARVPGDTPEEQEKTLERAARALAEQWPPRGRHDSSLALCGALARAGWQDEAIADFVAGVCVITGADPDVNKRLAQARSSCDKAARGEAVKGWTQLVEHMISGPDAQPDESRRPAVEAAVLAARRTLGMGPAIDLFTGATDILKQAKKAQQDAQLDAACAEFGGDATYRARLDDWAAKLAPIVATCDDAKEERTADPRPLGMDGLTLMRRDMPAPEYLVQYLIPKEGVGALSGEPKTGKSWDATYIAVCLASGKAVLGKFAVQRPVKVFYYYAEDTEAAIKIRIRAIAISLGLDPYGEWLANLRIQPRGRALNLMYLPDLCVLAASAEGCELMILDPLSNIHSGEEDKRDSMVKVMARLHAVEQELKCAVLFVHHSAKSTAENKGRKRGGQRMRGSSAIHGAVDFGIYVSDPQGDGKAEFTARVESELKAARGGGVFARTIKITDDANGNATRAEFVWLENPPTGNVPQDLADQRAHKVTQILFDQGGHLDFDQLKAKIKGDTGILRKAIDVARTAGWIRDHMYGKKPIGYEITEAGKTFVRDVGTSSSAPEPQPTSGHPVANLLGISAQGDKS